MVKFQSKQEVGDDLSVRVLKVSYYPVTFSGHRHSSSGEIMALVCHVIWQDHVIKEGSCDLLGGCPSSSIPVDTRSHFNVCKMSIRRRRR